MKDKYLNEKHKELCEKYFMQNIDPITGMMIIVIVAAIIYLGLMLVGVF